jgi:hypothetical protein
VIAAFVASFCFAMTPAPPAPPAAPAAKPATDVADPADCRSDLDFFAIPEELSTPTVQRPPLSAAERSARRHIRGAIDAKEDLTREDLERLDVILEVAREVNPALATRLRELRESDPAAVIRALQASGRKLQGMAELKQRDPEAYKFKVAEIRIERLVKDAAIKLRKAVKDRSGEAPALRQELRKHIMVQELVATRARGVYLERLKNHIKHLEESLNRDATQLQFIVDERLRDVMKEVGIPVDPVTDPARPALAADRSE